LHQYLVPGAVFKVLIDSPVVGEEFVVVGEALDHLVETQSDGAELDGAEDAQEVAKDSVREDVADTGTYS